MKIKKRSEPKTKKHCTVGPYRTRSSGYGTRIEGPNGEPIGWCGDNFSSKTGAVPHKENATLFSQSDEMYKLLEFVFKSKLVNDDKWNEKTAKILSSVKVV